MISMLQQKTECVFLQLINLFTLQLYLCFSILYFSLKLSFYFKALYSLQHFLYTITYTTLFCHTT